MYNIQKRELPLSKMVHTFVSDSSSSILMQCLHYSIKHEMVMCRRENVKKRRPDSFQKKMMLKPIAGL